jgi:glutamate racemase
MPAHQTILVFDCGLGGLTVLREIVASPIAPLQK